MVVLIDRSTDEERSIINSLGQTLEGISKSFVLGISKLPVVPAFDVSGLFEVGNVAYKFEYKITRLDQLDSEDARQAVEQFKNKQGDQQ